VGHLDGTQPGKHTGSNQHLQRRNGVYYYRRRVPLHLAAKFGKKFVQVSLHTTSLKEAKKRRTLLDLEWDAKFAACSSPVNGEDGPAVQTSALTQPLSEAELVQLVRDYVAWRDQLARKREVTDYPENPVQRAEMRIEAEFETQTLQSHDDLQTHQWIYSAGQEALKAVGRSFEDPAVPGEVLAELVRRALLELSRRRHARLADDYSRSFFDHLFDPSRPVGATFGKLAEEHLQLVEEDAAINGLGAKGLDRQRATIALIREIVGDETPVDAVDYNECLQVRSVLARLPANRTKLYGNLPIDQAIARAEKEGKSRLASVTQERYLAALRDILDLGTKKRLITVNPAEGLRPIKRDAVAASDKRKPFTLQQIADFFKSGFYNECAKHPPAFADQQGWRFWLPLLCLFTGARPNEMAQLHVGDLKRTQIGTWYLDIAETADDDEESTGAAKTLKTATSRRKIPLHPELIKVGFVQFIEQRKKASSDPHLFPDTYGNQASYALKRFRDTYLPAAIKIERRQSFYSFKHSWRDALRRIDAPPATLAAVGGWSQGKLTSDDYGDKSDPDFQIKFIGKISFPGLDLSPLHLGSTNLAKSAAPSKND
jgi:integrase